MSDTGNQRPMAERFNEALAAPDSIERIAALTNELTGTVRYYRGTETDPSLLLRMTEQLAKEPEKYADIITRSSQTAYAHLEGLDDVAAKKALTHWSTGFDHLTPDAKLTALKNIESSVIPGTDLEKLYNEKWDAMPDGPQKRAALKDNSFYNGVEEKLRERGHLEEGEHLPRLKYSSMNAGQMAMAYSGESAALAAAFREPDSLPHSGASNIADPVAQAEAQARRQIDIVRNSSVYTDEPEKLLEITRFLSTQSGSNPSVITEAAATAHDGFEGRLKSTAVDDRKAAEAAKLWGDAFDRLDPAQKLSELKRIEPSVYDHTPLGQAYNDKWDALPDSPTKRNALRGEDFYNKAEGIVLKRGVDIEHGDIPRLRYGMMSAQEVADAFVDNVHAQQRLGNPHRPVQGEIPSLDVQRQIRDENAAWERLASREGLNEQLKELRERIREGRLSDGQTASAERGLRLVPAPAAGTTGEPTSPIKSDSPPPPSPGGTKASGASAITAGPGAANDDLKIGHATIDRGNVAINPAQQNQAAAVPQLQGSKTTNVAQGRAEAANDVPVPQDEVSKGRPAEPKGNLAKAVREANHSLTASGAKAGLLGGAAVGGTVFVQEVAKGNSVMGAAIAAQEAVVPGAASYRLALQGDMKGAVEKGKEEVNSLAKAVTAAALCAAPLLEAPPLAAAAGLVCGVAGPQALEALMAGEKTIPSKVMQTNTRYLSAQEGMLKDAGLSGKDEHGKTAADYLRDPKAREAYLGSLKNSLARETNSAVKEQLKTMVETSEKFVEMEGRRVANLQPYMKDVEEKLAATLKLQQLAGQFQQDSKTAEIVPTPQSAGPAATYASYADVNPRLRN